MHKRLIQAPKARGAVCLIVVMLACSGLELWAATVSTYPFGRHEIVIQEGTPFALSEFLGMVRRQTGLPEYPLMLGMHKDLLELNILGPGNRPIQLAATKSASLVGSHALTTLFLVARSTHEGETLKLQVRRATAPEQVTLSVNLRTLERLLEGER